VCIRAAAISCCNIGLLLRVSGRLAIEHENFTQSDQQRCSESEPSIGFHRCLRKCRLLRLLNELYQCPVERVLRLAVYAFQKKCSLPADRVIPRAVMVSPANAGAALAANRESAVLPNGGNSLRMNSDSAPTSTPAELTDKLHAGMQFAGVEIERCELGLKRDCVEVARGAAAVLGQR
jgi:hypothetical protein